MSSASTRNIFGSDHDNFRERQSKALLRRVGAGITGKVVARALDVHPDTVMNWVNGRVTMDGAAIEALNAFFSAKGDHGFLTEVYAQPDVAREPKRAAFVDDLCLWFTDEGATHEAPTGHAQFVREALNISATAEDLPAYAIRNLGWIECLARPDGRIGLRYAATAADPAAAARARDWLVSESPNVAAVDLAIWRDGDWEYCWSATVSDAAGLLSRAGIAGSFGRFAICDWTVERLPLDNVKGAAMASLIAAFKQGTEAAKAVGSLGLFNMSSFFGVQGSNVTSLWIGSKLLVPIKLFANRNVLDRPDHNYAALIHHHVLESVKEGPTFYRLDIEIMGKQRRYERIALPQGRDLVVTSTKLLGQEVAA